MVSHVQSQCFNLSFIIKCREVHEHCFIRSQVYGIHTDKSKLYIVEVDCGDGRHSSDCKFCPRDETSYWCGGDCMLDAALDLCYLKGGFP